MKMPTVENYDGDPATVRNYWRGTGLTQMECARRLGVHERQVRFYLNGTRRAPLLFVLGLWTLEKIEMWVYIESEKGLWTVGFYDPDGKWIAESDHGDPEKAADRVAYLNGSRVADGAGSGLLSYGSGAT